MTSSVVSQSGLSLETTSRSASPFSLCRWVVIGLAILVLFADVRIARADDDSDSDSEENVEESRSNEAQSVTRSSSRPRSEQRDSKSGQPKDGPSLLFRAGIIEGQGISQNRSLVPIELFPYILSDDSLWFADLRFFSSYELTLGGNAGLGYRQYSSGLDRIFGISAFYDADHIREDNYFQQLGLSLESYGEIVDFRSNLYLPVGDTYQPLSLGMVPGSTQFSNNNVVYDQVRSFYAAMKGIDAEAGVAIPGDFAKEHGIRVFGGAYHFEDDHDGSITGGSARVQANIVSGLDMGIQVTNDSFYDTRAFVNLAWTFGPLHRSQMSQATVRGRLGEHVTRNQTVVSPIRRQLEQDVVARDPGTGQPYEVAHVDSGAGPGGTGTVSDPYQTIADAQASNRNIVFVHAGSSFSGADSTIVMNSGERILGDSAGVQHYIVVPELRSILLPHGPTGGSSPLLDLSLGNSVTLASNSEFSGFTISNSAGHGIVGNGVHDVSIRNVLVENALGDGVRLLNSTGPITLSDVRVFNSLDDGFVVDGGSANIRYSGELSSNNGHDLVVANTTGGFVDLTQATFPGSGSQGILIDNVAGDVNFDNLALNGTAGTGIEIHGTTGNVDFEGETSVSGADGPAIEITNLGADAHVTFDKVTIDHRHDAGMVLSDIDGTVEVRRWTTISNESGSTASAIDVQNSSGQVSFAEADVTDAIGSPGVNLENNTGLTWFDSLDITSNNATALYARNAGSLVVNPAGTVAGGGTVEATNGTAVDIENTAVNANFTSVSSNNAPVGLRLVDVSGTFSVTGDVAGTKGSGGTIENTTVGILLQDAETVGLSNMVIHSNGIGIQTNDVDKFAITNFQITDSTNYGLDASNTRTLIVSYSDFTDNGLANVHADFSQVGSYGYTFFSNLMNSDTSDNIHLEALAGSQGSVMNLTVDSNLMGNTHSGDAAVDVDWNGSLTASVVNTIFSASGASSTAVDISNAAIASPTNVGIDGNAFAGSGADYTAMRVVTNGSSQIVITRNAVTMGGSNGTGMRFGLAPSASVKLIGNTVKDTTDGGTGMLFDSISGPSSIEISGNILQFANSGVLLDRGIVFSSVTNPVIGGVTYQPVLSSAANNAISGADILFSIPAGTTTGFIVINGSAAP